MKYDYSQIVSEVKNFLDNNSTELYYVQDIAKELNYSPHVISTALKQITTNQLMSYTEGDLIYVHNKYKEKQIPSKYLHIFISNGWCIGRCDTSKRAISIGMGGNPDVVKTFWVHKDGESIQVTHDEKQSYYDNGYKQGKDVKGKNNPYFGKHHSIEVRKKMSSSWSYDKHDMRGWKWINDGVNNTLVDPKTALKLVEEYGFTYGNLSTNLTSTNIKEYLKKSRITMVERYGVDHNFKRPEVILRSHQNRIPWNKGKRYTLSEESKKQFLEKQYITKSKNNSFNKSKPEEEHYKYLLTLYDESDIIRQYKDSRYSFYCDFYIKSKDLFIECNYHWTHGDHPFDPTNQEDLKILEDMTLKAHNSKFYQVAVDVWSIKDVEKKRFAEENKLNYEVIYG